MKFVGYCWIRSVNLEKWITKTSTANVSWNIQRSIAHIFLWQLQELFYYMHKNIWKELSPRLFERLDSVGVQPLWTRFCTCLACVGGQCVSFARALLVSRASRRNVLNSVKLLVFNLVLIKKFCYSFLLIGKSIACRLVIFVDLTTVRTSGDDRANNKNTHVGIGSVLAARRHQRLFN